MVYVRPVDVVTNDVLEMAGGSMVSVFLTVMRAAELHFFLVAFAGFTLGFFGVEKGQTIPF